MQRLLLLTIGLLFSVLGCTRDRVPVLMPDDISRPMEVHESVDVEVSFNQNVLPILTARCALAGCHVADGPHGLDFRTYESFIAGGEHGPAFIPGNAQESVIVVEIVSGRMPPGGPPLTEAEIQLFIDWINQQEAHDDVIQQEHGDAHEAAHEEADGEHEDDEDGHDDMDAEHDGEDEHDNDDMDNAHDGDDDNRHDHDNN